MTARSGKARGKSIDCSTVPEASRPSNVGLDQRNRAYRSGVSDLMEIVSRNRRLICSPSWTVGKNHNQDRPEMSSSENDDRTCTSDRTQVVLLWDFAEKEGLDRTRDSFGCDSYCRWLTAWRRTDGGAASSAGGRSQSVQRNLYFGYARAYFGGLEGCLLRTGRDYPERPQWTGRHP